VPLALEVEGFLPTSPFGDTRVGFTASADINRNDFGIKFNMVLDNGGVGLGEKVHITLDIEAVLQPAS
jgi:polyisoprenoid-binding protein YceI